jgi:hypothetical protein
MIQLRIANVDIDLYDLDPPKLNFAIEDITDTSARSMFSRTFRVPATANNTQFFDTAFDINGMDFDVRQQISAQILVNGILFRSGQVRLNKVYDSREGQRIDYELIFLGETKDFGTSIGEGFLNELVLAQYDHALVYTAVTESWNAYPEGSITDGLFDGDIIYPLIDFGVNYDENGDAIETLIQQDNTSGVPVFTKSVNPLPARRFKPMIRAKAVIDEIFRKAGYTYTSNFFDSNRFKQIYLSAFGNDTDINTKGASNNMAVGLTSNSSPVTIIPFDNVFFDYGSNFNTTTHRYVVNVSGDITFDYSININATSGEFASGTLTAEVTKNGTTILDSDSELVTGSQSFTLNGNFTATLTAGDYVDIRMSESGSIDIYQIQSNSTFEVTDSPGIVNIAALLDDNYKQIDFIKDIITKFRLVLVPDRIIPNHFIIEPWQEYIGSGDILDWTKKLDVSKDFILEPLFYTQVSRIEYKDKEGEDRYNIINQEEFQEVFGSLFVNGDNDLLSGTRDITTNIIPTPVSQLERKNTSIGTTFIIPHLHVEEAGENTTYNPQHLPMRANSRLLFYNGLYDTDGISWYIQNDPANPYTNYPMVSFYEDFINTQNSLNLNWQKETGYIDHNINNGLLGNSVYDEYWSTYINSLYDGFGRKVTAYFILDDTDLVNFNFDNVIFVKNAYYYVSKITDVVIGKKAKTKVELIKLKDYKVRIIPTRPRRLWNTTYQNWEDAVFRWDI